MAQTEKRFTFGMWRKAVRSETDEAREQLLESLARTRLQIHQAYAAFNSAGDPDLIESYVFEINALQSRYSYLLRRVKELDEAPARTDVPELPAPQEHAEPL